ncbi:MAG: protein kinase domain-containing protein [Planctomycetota bacterium]|jgi:serine/threonine-protein kinase
MTGQDMHGETIDHALLKLFESAWVEGRPQPIEEFLPDEEDAGHLMILEELVLLELRLAWQAWSHAAQCSAMAPQDQTIARPANVETYLQRFPQLGQPELLLRLLQQEYTARRQCGEGASIEEYRRRFPEVVLSEDQFESAMPMVSQSSQDARLADTLATGQPGGGPGRGIEQQDFGNYESLEEIGRGGMGVVYRARQRTADRTVALKVIRRDRLDQLARDTQSSVVDRFRTEAQAAAKLEHENIVTVYEVGEIDGQPFFSMRYVEGRSLAEILHEGPMENRRAAAYLEPVARAVHEAHSQGILHRDLKPQNILSDDKSDRALVADFGLAKLTEGGDELTRAGEIMGTPSYMSPEQAKDSAHVTATTDVYALGATLYHVLTGRPPFQAATPVVTLRQVIDQEPAPPRQLNPSIDRDLETICLRCLQKEPSRRYDTAEALADDLRRYLAGEPILARPIGTLGRVWRWCRRKPALATAVGFAAMFFVVGSVVSTALWLQTREALKQSEEDFDSAQEAVDYFFTVFSEATLLNEPGMQPQRKELLTRARDYYQKFLSRRGGNPAIRDKVALAHYREGVLTEMIDSPELALISYRRALKMQQQLVSEHPHDRECLKNLGNTWSTIGAALSRQRKFNEARQALQEAVAVRQRLADQVGPPEIECHRKLANSLMNLGIVEMNLGIIAKDGEERKTLFEKARNRLNNAQALRQGLLEQVGDSPEVRRDLAKGYYNLAGLSWTEGTEEKKKDAETSFSDAIKVFESLLKRDPEVLDNQRDLATCYRLLGDLKSERLDPESAESAGILYQKALERTSVLATLNPAVPRYQHELARLHMNLAQLHFEQGRSRQAQEAFQQARDILQPLADNYDVAQYLRDLAVTLREIGCLQSDDGECKLAHANLETAKDYLNKLVEESPQNAHLKNELDAATAAFDLNLGRLQHQQGDADAAVKSLEQALGRFQTLAETSPQSVRHGRDWAVTCRERAQVMLESDSGEWETARAELEGAQGYLDSLVREYPSNVELKSQLEKTKAAIEALPPVQTEVQPQGQ